MKLTKFKLIDGGRGIEVEAAQPIHKSGMLILDKYNISRKIAVSDKVKDAVSDLKYSFLNLTGHWMPPFSNYIDDQKTFIPAFEKDPEIQKSDKTHEIIVKLWDHTRINGALIRDGAFMILGQIEVLDGKTIAINTPYICEDDDFHFFNETIERIEIAAEAIVEFLSGDKLSIQNSKKFLLDFYKDNKDSIARIKSQTDEENYDELFGLTEAAGGSRYLEENNPPKPGSEGVATLHDSKSTIDKQSYHDPVGGEQEENW